MLPKTISSSHEASLVNEAHHHTKGLCYTSHHNGLWRPRAKLRSMVSWVLPKDTGILHVQGRLVATYFMRLSALYHVSLCFCLHLSIVHAFCASSRANRLRNTALQSAVRSARTFGEIYADRLPQWLLDKCKALGFTHPTATQLKALEPILAGKDIVLEAQTGSGKTLAYALPLLASIEAQRSSTQGLVIVPTRELGLQVYSVLKQLCGGSKPRVTLMPVLDRSKNQRQIKWASADPPHIIVANPTPLWDLLSKNRLRCNAVQMMVLDEVDACITDFKHRKSVQELLTRYLSPTYQKYDPDQEAHETAITEWALKPARKWIYRNQRQTILCSASIPQRKHFTQQCVKQSWTLTLPELVVVSPDEPIPPQIHHLYIVAELKKRIAALRAFLKAEYKAYTLRGEPFQALVFVAEPRPTEAIADILNNDFMELISNETTGAHAGSKSRFWYDYVVQLSEAQDIDTRARIMQEFRDQENLVLVTDDMAARGLDVPTLTHVIQFDIPQDPLVYLHRSGRTGRVGRDGTVLTLISPEEEFVARKLSNTLSIKLKPYKPAKSAAQTPTPASKAANTARLFRL